jgi:uncharacterized protein (TIGR03790 family)
MNCLRVERWRLAVLSVSCGLALSGQAGGSGLNTVVVVNQNSTNSSELGNYYCERRQVPPDNLLRITWPGGNISWSNSDFQTNLLQPLLAMLAVRQLTNQIDYVVLSMDIPFQTVNGSTINSTTAALFYGLKPDTNGSSGYINSYAASEAIFRLAQPDTAQGYSFLTTMLTAGSLNQAKQLIDQGVSSDSTFPGTPGILQKTSDPSRNIRYSEFDNAIFNVRLLGKSSLLRTNSDLPPVPPSVPGYQTGLANFSVASNTFSPGAIADSLTSYGGLIFGPNDQTSLLAFIAAGAAGSYGTVAEPYGDPQKFPNSQDYFYQARGFTLAESYYQSLYDPYLGLIVGEPLAAPFAQPASGKWMHANSNAVLSATQQLSLCFYAWDQSHPVQQIDLFVDGKFYQTVTNLGPSPGNQLTLTLQGYPVSYTVPANATVATVVTGLVAQINTPVVTNITKVLAFAHGDRIELRSLSTNYQTDPFYYLDSTAVAGSNTYYRVNYLPFPTVPQLTAPRQDQTGAFHFHIETTPGVPSIVLASTDLVQWLPIATNLAGGELDFIDPYPSSCPKRFFRLAAPDQRPQLSLAANGPGSNVTIHVQTQTSLAYLLQASTDLIHWTILATNAAGGSMDFVDSQGANGVGRFYRTRVLLPLLTPATVTVQPSPQSGGNLVGVAGAARAYTLTASTNQVQWTPVSTNLNLGGGQVAVQSSPSESGVLSTFLSASQPTLLDSIACGLRTFYLSGTIQTGSWLQLLVTKTNGLTVSLAVTNQSGTNTLASLTQQLLATVNSAAALTGPDGLVGEDFMTDAFGSPSFHLRALSGGYAASGLHALLSASSDISLSPGSQVALNQNLSDLQPRNHLHVSAGASTLSVTFPIDTTTLPDGYHDLTAVAFEGSHVHTQTHAVLPVQIQNSSLGATLTLMDLTNGAPVQATYHLQVVANTNTVNAISLFSTGGLLATATNQPTASFSVNGASLGAGLHPFYALVQTSDGLQYRTQTQLVRLAD